MSKLIYSIILLTLSLHVFSQTPYQITGYVISAIDQSPIQGVTVSLKGSKQVTSTNENGQFVLHLYEQKGVIVINALGYQKVESDVTYPFKANLNYILQPQSKRLNEVQVSTGYQKIGITKTTGAFSTVSNEQLNLKVSADILSRLQDVVPGLIFNRNDGAKNDLSIRGQSTLFANTQPLIVIDNFPYDGDLNTLNPNDVENITVLKDAAAASIWGARAGNGVIVITTKKGRYNAAPQITFNTNLTSGKRPNLFYNPTMSASDFIDVEELLFKNSYYEDVESSMNKMPLSPAVELFIAARDGALDPAKLKNEINSLKSHDLRNDLKAYFYRRSLNQQHSLSISGGSSNQKYFLSAGLDRELSSEVGNGFNRFTINSSTSYALFKQKLELTAAIYYTQNRSLAGHPEQLSWNNGENLYPYAKLADAHGTPLTVANNFRIGFINDPLQKRLLNWEYKPLEELKRADNVTTLTDYRISADVRYHIIPGLNAVVSYQYGRSASEYNSLKDIHTYYTRNLINTFTTVNNDGSLTRPIPLGGILDHKNNTAISQNFRGQMNYNKLWNNLHSLDFLVGGEIRDQHITSGNYRLYGYDAEHELSSNVDYISQFPIYYNPSGKQKITNNLKRGNLTDRFISYFGNASYTYNQRYIATMSARMDRSNLFGVNTNQKGVPLFSLGLAWNLSEEQFYHFSAFPYLKLRATYGYNGNVDKTLSAYTTAYYYNAGSAQIRKPFAQIVNPPNPELRWERVRITNLGLDFGTKNDIFTGTIDLYVKKGIDLIGNEPFAPSTGILKFKGNTATTRGKGVDVVLNTKNIDQKFKWNTSLLMSYEYERVIKYEEKFSGRSYVEMVNLPIVGRPYNAIFSYPWAGLDPKTGEAQGYLDGKVSKDYYEIGNAATADNIKYHGPSRPTFYGALRNTFSYDKFSLSVNIGYRFGYYFRKPTVSYSTVLSGNGGHGDYALRWQKPGDEKFTSIPAMPSEIDTDSDNFYSYASPLVERGDHIRLNDIHLSYRWKYIQFYTYANNIGVIWKKTKTNYDPDYLYALSPPARTISVGLKAAF